MQKHRTCRTEQAPEGVTRRGDPDLAGMERELHGPGFRSLLRKLPARGEASWEGIVSGMRNGPLGDPWKDRLLGEILGARRRDGDPRWNTVLLVIFWPGLRGLWSRKSTWDPDRNELWQNVLCTFLEILGRVDPAQRSSDLARKVLNDTAHHLHDRYRAIWKGLDRERSGDAERLNEVEAESGELPRKCLEFQDLQEVAVRQLRKQFALGRISKVGLMAIVETRIRGLTLVECARRSGVPYPTLRKRRLRAERALRRLKPTTGFADFMSLEPGVQGPFPFWEPKATRASSRGRREAKP